MSWRLRNFFKAHLEWLEPNVEGREGKAFDYPDLFREAADTLRLRSLWHEALRFYDPLQQVEEHTDSSYFNDMGLCYRALELYDQAEDCFRIIIKNDKCNTDALFKLATMFENANMPDRAAQYVDEIIALKRERTQRKRNVRLSSGSILSTPGKPLGLAVPASGQAMLDPSPARKQARLSAVKRVPNRQLLQAQTKDRIQLHYLELRAFKEQYESGSIGDRAEWMETAKVLIDEFSKTKAFFPVRTENRDKTTGDPGVKWRKTLPAIGGTNSTTDYVPEVIGQI